LIFCSNTNHEIPLFSIEDDAVSDVPTKLRGQHLVLRNIAIINTVYNIKSIEIPPELHLLKNLIKQ
jgi:hypothetical protein